MTQKQRYGYVLKWFMENCEEADSELNFSNNFELLVAVVLSAQCTDRRVNMVTPALFEKMPTAKVMSQSSETEIYELIKSVSYPNSKAKYLHELSCVLEQEFGGVVQDSLEELRRLPGVGQKTANVVLAEGFGESRIAVDTHVFRVSNRIGLTDGKDPTDVEEQLMDRLPKDQWIRAHHLIIFHGRKVCHARKPDCDNCEINDICLYKLSGGEK
jgi:endonuclease-3